MACPPLDLQKIISVQQTIVRYHNYQLLYGNIGKGRCAPNSWRAQIEIHSLTRENNCSTVLLLCTGTGSPTCTQQYCTKNEK